MMLQMSRFVTDEDGATALEYGLLAALIAAVIVGAVTNLGQVILNTFEFITAAMDSVINAT